MINPCNQIVAGGQDGSEPAGFAGRVADQPVGDTGLVDAAFVVWIAGAGGDSDVAEPAPVAEARIFRRRFRAGTRTSRTLRRSRRRRCREIFAITQRLRRRDTFIYDFLYRRVEVDPNSLQVSADLIPLLSQPVRVGGPGVTWFHDTRSPGPLDAVKGQYTTLQTFLASSKFGSQTDFWKIDGTNSTYYQFGKLKYVIARSTRIGYEQSWGPNPERGEHGLLESGCTGQRSVEHERKLRLRFRCRSGCMRAARTRFAGFRSTEPGRGTCRRDIRWAGRLRL